MGWTAVDGIAEGLRGAEDDRVAEAWEGGAGIVVEAGNRVGEASVGDGELDGVLVGADDEGVEVFGLEIEVVAARVGVVAAEIEVDVGEGSDGLAAFVWAILKQAVVIIAIGAEINVVADIFTGGAREFRSCCRVHWGHR